MTSKERILALLQGRPVDHIPCVPLVMNHAARVLGVKVSEFNSNPRVMTKAHLASWEKYGYDMILIFTTTATIAEAMGTTLYFPEDDVPYVHVPAVQSPEDIKKVKIIEPQKDGRIPVYLEAAELCLREVKNQVPVGVIFAGPFTTAAHLRGTEVFVKETYKNPQLVKALLEIARESINIMLEAILHIGAVPVLVEPVASGSLISPNMFSKYVFPYVQQLVDRAHELGSPICLHICGNANPILDLMADTGADILSLDYLVDLEEAKVRVGSKACLMGNIAPADILLRGSPDRVVLETKKVIAKASDNPKGLIVASGCEVPLNTPAANLKTMVDTVRMWGNIKCGVREDG
ncbi:uroporphyrinogen decarboxylase [Thermanaeromonas toyohensis ToBE]|uniref:Uroporphyrinogen decarboxylase n=1 Tax=Thermanaeromonas toyohensis ToBE TaxID=698762 RepID=A0A1W1VAZ7_9FIRM|nr:uroporphyrinogen decarboxylase family protein [Thermanaeromonas toyohensis]SMB90528.1 uroporphyrinogen decarboxylase [Thermanaeromonas toyohensis ToBE]